MLKAIRNRQCGGAGMRAEQRRLIHEKVERGFSTAQKEREARRAEAIQRYRTPTEERPQLTRPVPKSMSRVPRVVSPQEQRMIRGALLRDEEIMARERRDYIKLPPPELPIGDPEAALKGKA